MIPADATDQLNQLLRDQYSRLDNQHMIEIAPDDLASRVYKRIDSSQRAPSLVRYAAFLELKQLARAICRARAAGDESDTEQTEIFALQLRYPAERDGRDVYVLRQELKYSERRKNEARLEAEGAAKIQHARMLRAETDELVRQGILVPDIEEPPAEDPSQPSLIQ